MSKTAHGFIQTARGLITDDAPPTELDGVLARAVEAVKDVEAERDAYKALILEVIEYVANGRFQLIAQIAYA